VIHRELNGLCGAHRKPEAQRVDWTGLTWHYVPSKHLSTEGGLDYSGTMQPPNITVKNTEPKFFV